MQFTATGEQYGDDDKASGSDDRLTDGHDTKQVGDEQCQLRGDARILRTLAPVAHGSQRDDQHGADRDQQCLAQGHGAGSCQRRQRKSAHACQRAPRTLALAAFALNANQQSAAKRSGQSDHQGFDSAHGADYAACAGN